MRWTDDGVTAKDVTERGFEVERDGRVVPAVLWSPATRTPSALVLAGHGGSGHKRQEYVLAIARRLVRHHGFAVAAIDGPAHGDRADSGVDWRGSPTVVDDMVADWQATLDALQANGVEGPVGYWGLSMGCMFGVPLVAAEPRIVAAVLGLMRGFGRLETAAARITCPVLFLQQLDDELIPRDGLARLFDAIGTSDKRLHANPGRHQEVPREEMEETERFLATRLSARPAHAGAATPG